MITYIKKDITTVEQGVVVHGCNCQGKMGSGVALAIRNKWPTVFDRYEELCKGYIHTRPLLLGTAHYVKVAEDVYVGNWFTQLYYGNDGKRYADPSAIKKCLFNSAGFLTTQLHEKQRPLYMPRIGCKLGGLSWEDDVEPIVIEFDQQHRGLEIYVCDI